MSKPHCISTVIAMTFASPCIYRFIYDTIINLKKKLEKLFVFSFIGEMMLVQNKLVECVAFMYSFTTHFDFITIL